MKSKFEDKDGMIIIRDYDSAMEVLRNPTFIVPDMSSFLCRLSSASNRDLATLRLFIDTSPFFLEGERHSTLRHLGQFFLGHKFLTPWKQFFSEQIEKILLELQDKRDFDLVETIGNSIFTDFLRPFLGVYPLDVEAFDRKAIVLQRLIEPMLSINKLQQVNTDLSELLSNLDLNISREDSLESVFAALLKGDSDYTLTMDEKKAFVIILYAATAPLSQTIVNILTKLYEDGSCLITAEFFLENIDYYILKAAAPVFIHRVALQPTNVGQYSINQGNTVLIEISSSFHRGEESNVGCPVMPNVRGLAFGYGSHFCLGAFLSKLLIKEFIPKFIRQFPRLEILSKESDLSNHIAHAYVSVSVKQSIN